ncbi:MAG: flavin reductase family protein [Clostridia bacterium]|nr:flavin reductase family protein [Clostridia bacterium]
MKKVWKPGTLLAPVPPTMVSCGTMENPNILTVGWTGITCTDPAQTYISVRKERHSHSIISQNGYFVINLPTVSLAKACDFCGVKSGRDINKFAHLGLTPVECEQSGCPAIGECPVSIECKVDRVIPLGSHDMFMATFLSVSVDEKFIEDSGRLALEKADLLAYAHGSYFALGKNVGTFGFSVRKKKKRR